MFAQGKQGQKRRDSESEEGSRRIRPNVNQNLEHRRTSDVEGVYSSRRRGSASDSPPEQASS